MWVISSMPQGNMGEASATGEGAVKQAWWPTHLMRGAGPLERESSIIQREVGKEREKGAIGHGAVADMCLSYTILYLKGGRVAGRLLTGQELSVSTSSVSAVYGCQTCQERPCWCASVYLAQLHCIKMCHCFCFQVSSLWPHAAAVWGGAVSAAHTGRWASHCWKDGDSFRAESSHLRLVPSAFQQVRHQAPRKHE